MIINFIILTAVSLILFVFGWLIWKKDKINLIHSYHYKNVSEKDKKAYSEKMGLALITLGSGLLLSALTDLVIGGSFGWIFIIIFFIWGFSQIIRAQKSYNKGLF